MSQSPYDKLTSILKDGDYRKIKLIQGKEKIPALGRKLCGSTGPCIYFFEGSKIYGKDSLVELYNNGELEVDGKKKEPSWWGGKSRRRRRRNRSTKRRYRKSSKRFS
jgi:hypothetical protein